MIESLPSNLFPLAPIPHLCVVGCGLIGGSFALAVKRAGFTGRITVCGGSRSLKLAVERGVADAIEESFDRGAMCDADLIYLAAPIGAIIDFLRTRGALIKPGAIVTDAGSTKAEIARVAQEVLPPGVHFIGGHPMAGSEQTGVEYARADLFDGATYALMTGADEIAFDRLRSLIESIGARVLITDPHSHDSAAALISHLPQLTASVLSTLLDNIHEMPDANPARRELARRLAATGWRDMTRLAGSSWSVWRDICLTNQNNISTSLAELIAVLQSLQHALDIRDFNQLRDLFTAANDSVAQQRATRYKDFDKL